MHHANLETGTRKKTHRAPWVSLKLCEDRVGALLSGRRRTEKEGKTSRRRTPVHQPGNLECPWCLGLCWAVRARQSQLWSQGIHKAGKGQSKGRSPGAHRRMGKHTDKESSMEENKRGSLEEVVLLLIWKGGWVQGLRRGGGKGGPFRPGPVQLLLKKWGRGCCRHEALC